MSAIPTSEQLRAIECTGNAVITARPGSGKTFTLARMIARESACLLSYQGIIAISYTNGASDELRARCDRLGIEHNRSFFGTIDKFCIGQVIAPFASHLTGRDIDYEIVEDSAFEGWGRLAGRMPNDPELKAFIRGVLLRGKLPIGALGAAALYTLDAVPQAQAFIKSRYKSIFIDEYQDCGLYQHLLLKLLVSYGLRGTAVGDIDQAIFRFADKSPDYLLDLTKAPGFEHFQITENHRCDRSIQAYSLALLRIKTDPIEPQNRRVFAIHMRGDERVLAKGIRTTLPRIMEKYGVTEQSNVALLGTTNAVLDRYSQTIGIPNKRFKSTPLDRGLSRWRRLFTDLLRSYYDPNRFSGLFLDSHAGGEIKPAKRNRGLTLLDEYFALSESELATELDLARELARFFEPGAEHAGDVEAYRCVVTNRDLLRDAFRPAQPDEINILTYHKAKGLEFDIVFCLEAYRFVMPIYKYAEKPYDAYGQAIAMHYVGITRARKVCYILLGDKRTNSCGLLKDAEPSEFLSFPELSDLRIDTRWD